ncbi:putative membrane protein [Wickerhamomyces ciferrii]|uniref:Membrane protein n=1 Tax=Wickerhamomyces ciferrii (strain ATCC 14091 / BCRC 22168 / CBS 111 / JCM 3599 / NBRC 0793 / NRRL Y-1031 F-60-10) TaxID=1206466 RepID=K0KU10_WICCF|nr:uncharacterized protein BN7_5094 [Wickerhamomyces ciferrii]CCH45512.1 putative membrane protein [Wickerhamomyces ciferrii]
MPKANEVESESSKDQNNSNTKELLLVKWTICFSIWVWILVSSRTFQSILPLKFLPSDLGVYGDNPTDLISMIDGISTNETSTKVLEPAVIITNADLLLSFKLYEYDIDVEPEDLEMGKILSLSFQLDRPAANYFGLNSDFMYDLQSIFDDTIYDLYFDEFATDFKDSMDLDKLSKWLQVLGVLRLVLLIFMIALLLSVILSFIPQKGHQGVQKIIKSALGSCLTLIHIGFIICMSFIIHTFPSGVNGLNLSIMVMGLIFSIIVAAKGLS